MDFIYLRSYDFIAQNVLNIINQVLLTCTLKTLVKELKKEIEEEFCVEKKKYFYTWFLNMCLWDTS